jgi:hypothetical protein
VKRAERLQDLGDEMRKSGDHAAVARELIRKVRDLRGRRLGHPHTPDAPVLPDGTRRAYILDSVRHPAEVHLLRGLYQTAFTLLGVVCDDEEERIKRLTGKFQNLGKEGAIRFMERDRKAQEPHGQRVEQAFHLSDYFLDNSASRRQRDGKENPEWSLVEHISRFVKIVTHQEIVRPTIAETAMYAAFGAKLRSACLSRQVGAALVDLGKATSSRVEPTRHRDREVAFTARGSSRSRMMGVARTTASSNSVATRASRTRSWRRSSEL